MSMSISLRHDGDDRSEAKERVDTTSNIPTPPPPFDIAQFARESDTSIRAAALAALPEKHESVPPDMQSRLEEGARRAEVLGESLRVGALSRDEVVRALRSELAAIAAGAKGEHLGSLAAATTAFGHLVEELGGLTPQSERGVRHVLLLDHDPSSRALVGVAAEVIGLSVRSARDLAEFTRLVAERKPDVVLVAAALRARFPRKQTLCAMIAEIVPEVPVVLFADANGVELRDVARVSGAEHYVTTRGGVDHLMAELSGVLDTILA
jgi:CheY-like chemotaxis protein